MRYFYVSFTCLHGRHGNQVIRQTNPEGGLDLAGAHIYLMKLMQEPTVVLQWQEISESQYLRFCDYVEAVKESMAQSKPKAPVFTLVGGKKDESPDRGVERETGKREDDGSDTPPGAG